MQKHYTQLLFSFLLILLTCNVYGQGTVKGVILDQEGEALIGATIMVVGTSKGSATDFDGSYEITDIAVGTVTLRASYTGYKTVEETVTIESGKVANIEIIMGEDVAVLDQVVIVGYGTQRKRDLVGNVSKIENKELLDVVGGSFENVLQGKAAGVQITQSSGIAGAGSIVRIRGVGSISAGGDPLYVIDGLAISQDQFSTGSRNGQNNNPLSSINPNDIESIEILKDASAAAIYGSRGANGVILITTKRGKTGKPKFSFSTRFGTSDPTRIINLMDSDQWLQVRQESYANDGNTGRVPLPNVLVDEGIISNNLDYAGIEGINTDWLDQVIHTGLKQEYNLSMRQGNDRMSSYVGASYTNAESYLIGNSYERASLRANIDYNVTKKFKVGLSTSIVRGLNQRVKQAWSGGLGTAQTTALPIYPIYKEDGSFFNIYANPVAERAFYQNHTREWRSINNISFKYAATDNLSFNVTGSYDFMDLGDFEWESAEWTQGFNIGKEHATIAKNWSTYATANYIVPIANPDHSLTALVGVEYQATRINGEEFEANDVAEILYKDPIQGENYMITRDESVERDKSNFASAFARVNYNFQGKYFIQGTFRRDGSSKFGPNKRFGNFPSIGVGYILSEEPFMKDSPISFLKLKASWGITGNANINWRRQFGTSNVLQPGEINEGLIYNDQPIRNLGRPDNPDLQWEVVTTYDGGIEIGLFNDRVSSEFSYYYKKTTDMLINLSLQSTSGLDDLRFLTNVGALENKGFEFSLTTRNLVGQFRWKTSFNVSQNRNKVLDVGNAPPDALDGGFGDTRVVVGLPMGTNFLVPFSRIDPETGRPIYFDLEGNETFEYDVVNNRQPVANLQPDFVGGITNSFNYKGFDLSFLITFQIGGKIYDDAAKRQLGVVTDWNMRQELFDRWREPGDIATFPQLTQSMINWGGNANFWQNNHSLWLYDGTYARMKNITLGYTKQVDNPKSFIRGWRVYINATNVLTWTKEFTGWDPEIVRDRNSDQERNIGGTSVTYLTPPQERAINIGVNVDF